MRYFGLLSLAWLVAGSPGVFGSAGAALTASAAPTNQVAEAAAPVTVPDSTWSASEVRIARALTEALRVATDTVVARLGRPGGFAADPAIRIPLPGGLTEVRDGLVAAGLGPLVDDLEQRMNRAAERAVPEARAIIRGALGEMTIDDAGAVLAGSDDSATRYFEQRASATLIERTTPIVDAALRDVGAIAAFDAFLSEYAALPLMPNIRGSLTDHVVDGTLAGVLHHMAEQERAIRNDPAARTSALLRSVFGG